MPEPVALSYEVLVSDGVPRKTGLRLPNGDGIVSSPISSTLIYGEQDAVLVDPPLTQGQIAQVAEGVARSGKRLACVYITHGHPDHWFGTATLLEQFGDAGTVVYATEGTIRQMREQLKGKEEGFANSFPQVPENTPVLAVPVPADGFRLEGRLLRAVETGHTDTDDSSVLHVPSIGLVVAGDVVYNGVHQMMLEGGNGGLQAWLDGIDRIAGLNARHVVAGHKNKDLPDDPKILDETRQYLRDTIRLLADNPTPLEFFDEMMKLHSNRLNPGPLWYSGLGLLA
ncbi:MBL fold metallo-hydrolase [Streptomyces pinistramenti]|uniref:MBL fold metallo-hydrolase n=1 Tax=Streptomyces pinistramenti TaxID=2884812 RepID=UPI001D066B6A|nr:MBL fold metallo-hydrolase [Streptomyces pinistramenti]MCB5909563.1 MBL fold metallo-hydrolase [Streptomyces pinistramenti]